METYANLVLEEAHENAVELGGSATHLRLTKFPQPGGGQIIKDPIYSYLVNRSRTDFSTIIHELPLYMLNRSLLVDDEGLYRTARRLYTTRNRIVHRGESDDTDEASFAMEPAGSRTGLNTAIKVCEWFGMSEKYAVPGGGHVELQLAQEDLPLEGTKD